MLAVAGISSCCTGSADDGSAALHRCKLLVVLRNSAGLLDPGTRCPCCAGVGLHLLEECSPLQRSILKRLP